ncbi:hypothetical protein C2E23DRAFT_890904 [Lenzites betulinus]|nr:hypothetical protein C2E23DRAFT_890904 [Lenzites betulinus]
MNISPTSAVHRSLVIDEIFQYIANSLCASVNKRTLATLARTCKTFHEASLPALWEYQESLVPLLRLLPADTWIEVPHVNGGRVLQITRADRIEWTRFDYYAKHVRHFYWREREDVSLLALTALSFRRSVHAPLLPKLLSLSWHEIRPQYFSFIHLFLAPTIQAMHITVAELEAPILMAFFANARRVCKNVETFHICSETVHDVMPTFDGFVGDALAEYLRSLQKLKEFCAEICLSARCVETLAALPRLATVEMFLHDAVVKAVAAYPIHAPRGTRGWFAALEMIALNVDHLDHHTKKLLGRFQGDVLRELLIQSVRQPTTAELAAHLEVVRRAPYADALETLQLEFEQPHDETHTPPVALDVGAALKPLYALPQIDTLIIRSFALAVDGRALRTIAEAWPRLEALSLISYAPHPPAAGNCAGLADLVPLALRCERLLVLELHLEAFVVPDRAARERLMPAATGPSRCPLRCLTVFNAPLVDPRAAVAFLERLFPKVWEVEYRGGAVFPHDAQDLFARNWGTVQAISRLTYKSIRLEDYEAEVLTDVAA